MGTLYATSQDDDTILEGVTVSGRNGKCEKQTVATAFSAYKDMETCKKANVGNEKYCKPMFDRQKLVFGEKQVIYDFLSDECPPKNGVWEIELETNFGTYVYELQDN